MYGRDFIFLNRSCEEFKSWGLSFVSTPANVAWINKESDIFCAKLLASKQPIVLHETGRTIINRYHLAGAPSTSPAYPRI